MGGGYRCRGKTHVSTFRKTVASAATVANDFIDYTYFAGNPQRTSMLPRPLRRRTIDSIRGIHVPQMLGAEKTIPEVDHRHVSSGQRYRHQ
jgi:hypothetical protein